VRVATDRFEKGGFGKKIDTSLTEPSMVNLPSRDGAAVKAWDRQLRTKTMQGGVPVQWN